MYHMATVVCGYSVIFTDEQVQEHYDEFFEEIFVELEDKVKVAFVSWSFTLRVKPCQLAD